MKKRTDNRTETTHNNKTIYTIHTALRSRATNTRWRSTITELPIAHLRTYSTIPNYTCTFKQFDLTHFWSENKFWKRFCSITSHCHNVNRLNRYIYTKKIVQSSAKTHTHIHTAHSLTTQNNKFLNTAQNVQSLKCITSKLKLHLKKKLRTERKKGKKTTTTTPRKTTPSSTLFDISFIQYLCSCVL